MGGGGALDRLGVGEVVCRVISKCVMKIVKPDVIDASGPLQVCAGQTSGSEAAIHAMHNIFDTDDTDAILCPTIATYTINTYRLSTRLFVVGGQKLKSSEGTMQGNHYQWPFMPSVCNHLLQAIILHLLQNNACLLTMLVVQEWP